MPKSLNNSQNLTIVWHRRDLRIADNPALDQAIAQNGATIGIFIFDPQILESKAEDQTTGAGQVDFMLGCLQELQAAYQDLGSDLLFFHGDPAKTIRDIAQTLNAARVFFNQDVEPFARERDRQACAALAEIGVEVKSFLDLALHAPDAISTNSGTPYKVYTPFWRSWIAKAKPQPLPSPAKLVGLDGRTSESRSIEAKAIALPRLADLGFSCDQDIPTAGIKAAEQCLQDFCDTNKIFNYQQERNFPANPGTSMLSPHLRFGTIGIRQVWQATVAATEHIRSDEEKAGLQTWRQELAWREFYQHVLFHFPDLATGAYRSQMQVFEWDDDEAKFAAWCKGETGYPIVDAAMRQLNQTGWMHNRCRMIVASFLTKDLIINWQWGERYFMEKLVDGDQAANNGGWQWSASSGMDPKPLRIFNPASQARKYDKDGEYIRRWIPELAGLTTAELLSGNITPQQCKERGYPMPIVDHAVQQREFKRRYGEAKESL
ncbi:Deoxyribodipyrimidine photo-lyase [Thalassoporum mexicanum PCC 7367]|uniref:cryptochrome/photolyase family protein n=1 Tax=Thalassoporum mexicanum TaxID=3457544 RepID=UPI00029F9BBE|nr:deoxyribodipyrimidine photo-lyase [Pseudanabaena sp. PCC 7367]AFY70396.1 Deoxyribodipyrimidine photo-lyase [Pseudanabaena sp. PCC 7367]